MTAKKKIASVEVDGVKVEVDVDYTQSWDGIRKSAHVASSELTDEERGSKAFEYYEHAIANIDDVSQKLGDEPALKVMEILNAAITEATPKN